MKQLYRVSFFKRLTDSTGHQVDAIQGVVEVEGSRKSRAILSARRKFTKIKGVQSWSLRADYERVDVIPRADRDLQKLPLGMGNVDDLLELT
jgi:hypothetical protein